MNADYQEFNHNELTEKIIAVFYKVYSKLGYGFLEKIYKNAMIYRIWKRKTI
ncbi:MAG: GxxExxY protein [Candidatus Firestonebacteria bacterium]